MSSLLLIFEPWVICATTLVLSMGGFLVWPSRWNIPAYFAFAFWTVSIFVPVVLTDVQGGFGVPARVHFMQTMILGAVSYGLGLSIVGWGSSNRKVAGKDVARFLTYAGSKAVRRRALALTVGGVVLVAWALLRMGVVPMFAESPLEAKFFRGQYAAAYAPVAELFRLGNAIITTMIPITAAYAYQRTGAVWRVLLLASIGAMLVTLQRGPAATGLLLLVGFLLVRAGRHKLFMLLSVAVLIAGTLFYTVLAMLNIGAFGVHGAAAQARLTEIIASTAPDVADQLAFMTRWERAAMPHTDGWTIIGGLVPGNFNWNPAVWSITLGNPNIDIQGVASGGMRLPMPMWGEISWGTAGIVIFGFVTGCITAAATRWLERTMPRDDAVGAMLAATLYTNLIGLPLHAPNYTTVIQLFTVAGLMYGIRIREATGEAEDVQLSRPKPCRGSISRTQPWSGRGSEGSALEFSAPIGGSRTRTAGGACPGSPDT